MHTQRSQPLLKARERIVLAISRILSAIPFRRAPERLFPRLLPRYLLAPALFFRPFSRENSLYLAESRRPFKLDHYLANSQHTTIAVFAARSLIIRPEDTAPRGIKILMCSLTRAIVLCISRYRSLILS